MGNIALLGRRGSGKTTVATELMRRGYKRQSWAAPLKELARWAYGHIDKASLYEVETADSGHIQVTGRWILQRIGTEALRNQVDMGFWIKCGLRTIEAEPEVTWVNDDTRYPNEVEALRHKGFLMVWIAVPDDVRRERLGSEFDPIADEHSSETSVTDHDADVIVDGTLTPKEIVDHILEADQMLRTEEEFA